MKNRKFKYDFQLVVNGMLSIYEFERGWHDLIKKWFGKYCIHGQNIWKEGKLGKALVEGQVLCMDEQYTEKQEGKLHVENVSLNVVAETTKSVISNFYFKALTVRTFIIKWFVARDSSMSHFVTQHDRLLFDRDKEQDIAKDQTKQVILI